jgi:low temperature requirement protein LtrA
MFAVPYVAVRVVGLLLYYWVAWDDAAQRRAVAVFGLFSFGGLAAVTAGALLGGPALYWCWSLAIVLDLVAAGIGGQLEGWNLHTEHFVERHGLIVIIALGETLIVAAGGLTDAPATLAAGVTAMLAVTVTCGLWWIYFSKAKPAFEHALASRQGNARSSLARDVFSVMHFPMLCGVVALAVGTEEALAHPDHSLPFAGRVAFGAGSMLFVCGTAAALWRATGRLPVWRAVVPIAGALAIITVGAMPWAALSLVLAMLVAISVAEARQPATA